MFKYLCFLTLLCFAVSAECFSQCCAAGNPLNTGNTSSGGSENVLDISLSYVRSYSDTYFQGTNVSDYKYIDNSSFDYSMLMLKYGILEGLQVTAELGYFYSKKQAFDFGDGFTPTRKANGFGDGAIGIIYELLNDKDLLFGIYPNIKLSVPVGVFDQMDGPVVMPIDIQPSSGSYKYTFGLTMLKGFEDSDFSMAAAGVYEIAQRIETERTNYKYGNQLNISLSGAYNLTDILLNEGSFVNRISANLELRANIREKSSDREKKLIESTGGSILFLAPRINIGFSGGWGINFQFDLPVYKNINGLQLTNKNAFTAGFTKSIDFGSSHDSGLLPGDESIGMLPKVEFRVEGNCDMCKARIEKAAGSVENVSHADWNVETKILTVWYKTQVNVEQLKKVIAKAGHDNDLFKATGEDYAKLHSCCKYR